MLNSLKKSEKQFEFEVPSSAYVHIPFCRRRCYYCDFPVSVVGDRATGSTSGTIAQYVEVLCQEIAITPAPNSSLETVFFGGGTPSLLSVEQLERILATLEKYIGIAAQAEISMEIDPGTFSRQQIQGYRNAGVTRISLGVQAFQDELLTACGRSHQLKDILAAIDLICQVEVPDFSLDLISGLPHQTLEQWHASLEAAINLAPTHISCYDLTVEPITAFGRQYTPGNKPLPTEDATAQMYRLAQQVLTHAGYKHYEISNYALPSHQCRHNRVYWENRPFYGFGMGAASYLRGQRFTRARTRREYYAWVQQLVEVGGILDYPKLSDTDVLLETLMLGLRLAEGLSLSTLQEQFGAKTLELLWKSLQPYYQDGWVEVRGTDEKIVHLEAAQKLPMTGRVRLSDPEGFLFSNTVLSDLFNKLG
ncbi:MULTISPECIES: radical SAM family heme chaperone HemW [unclassified Coleofasciculus]|uniref:radical SAM family heme chaperone HemW n=1 Tax=unclassified Coleofasciculus TaxID=2692782 RepID=UPI002AD2709F|nr:MULTISPECIES: radical SAM family heme chaperone HemW [unclassified Coleofasciculus]